MIESLIEDLINWLNLLNDQENQKLFNNNKYDINFFKNYEYYIKDLQLIKYYKNKESQILEIKKILEKIGDKIKRKIPQHIQNKWIAVNL